MGHDAFFHADQEDVRVLQALAGVDGGQAHGVAVLVTAFQAGHERDVLGHVHQRLAVVVGALADPVTEFADVLPAGGGAALVALFGQVGLVVDGADQRIQHGGGGFALGTPFQAVDEVAEDAQRMQLPIGQAAFHAGLEHGLEQADVTLAGVFTQQLEGLRTDAASGRGGRADEGRIVVVVGQQAQVGAQVLDLGTVEERLAAGDLVGDVLFAKHLLDDPRLVVAAVEHGEVGPFQALLEAGCLNALDDGFGFVLVVIAGQYLERIALAQGRPQRLGVELGVLGDEGVGRVQDGAGGAVVLLQLDDGEVGKVLPQTLEVLQRGAAPAVDGLIVVAHSRQARAVAHQLLQERVLRHIGVLVFVHQKVAQLFLPEATGFLVLAQQLERQADQVVEVHRLVALQRGLVLHVGAGDAQLALAAGFLERRLGFGHGVLPQRDARGGQPDELAVGGLQELRQQAGAVVAVEDRERGLESDAPAAGAQHLHAQRVEGGDGRPFGGGELALLGEALGHFGRRLVGEGDGRNGPAGETGIDQVQELGGDDAGLARAGAGNDQAGAVQVLDGLGLCGIEFSHGWGMRTAGRSGRTGIRAESAGKQSCE